MYYKRIKDKHSVTAPINFTIGTVYMYSVDILVMVCVLALCIGGLIGAIISRSFFPPEQQKKMEESLRASQQELNQYQTEVTQHFADTAQLVNNLTADYKKVHDHLANGALKLTNPEVTQQMISAGDDSIGNTISDKTLDTSESLDNKDVDAPKDWAPKIPGEAGTLSEEYGLNDKEKEEPEPSEKQDPKI